MHRRLRSARQSRSPWNAIILSNRLRTMSNVTRQASWPHMETLLPAYLCLQDGREGNNSSTELRSEILMIVPSPQVFVPTSPSSTVFRIPHRCHPLVLRRRGPNSPCLERGNQWFQRHSVDITRSSGPAAFSK